MKYKLFLSDFDMTMGIAPDKIEPETVEAVKDYIARGGIFVICTGRSYYSIKKICDKYGLGGVVIAFQGALAKDVTTNKIIFDGGLDNADAALAISDLKERGFEVGAYIEELCHYDYCGEMLLEYERLVGVVGKKVDNLEKYALKTSSRVKKLIALNYADKVTSSVKELGEKYNGKMIVNTSSKYLLEVVNPEYSKGQAVKRIAKYFNIPLSQVIAVGDSTNDITLIDGEWHGVAVGDAMEELKKYAKEITVDFDKQPIKVLLEKYGK